MKFEELTTLLKKRRVLIVHCSRPGKGDAKNDASLFPDDLKNAAKVCERGQGALSCSLIWPEHIRTFGAVGIILELGSLASITSISPIDSGTSVDSNGMRKGGGVPYSAEAVMDTFANSTDYNEWTITNAKTVGIFVNDYHPLEVARRVSAKDIPGYDPKMAFLMDNPDVNCAVAISLDEIKADFPNLPIYRYQNGEIVQIST